jgi:hypothetical protein
MNHRAPLPFSAPRWLTPNRIAYAAIAVFAFATAVPAVWWITPARHEIGRSGSAALIVAACTTLLSLLLARRALRAQSLESAVIWSVLGAIPAGAINAGLCLGSLGLIARGDPGAAVIGFFAGALIGGFVGGPVGLGYGAAYAIVIGSAVRARLSPSHDAPDRVLRTAGLWLTLTGLAQLCLSSDDSPVLIPPAAVIAAGAVIALTAMIRLSRRKKWLARVAAGLNPAFRIEAPSEERIDAIPTLLPVLRRRERKNQSNYESILAYIDRKSGSPYREDLTSTPLALVDLPPHDADPARSPRNRDVDTEAPGNTTSPLQTLAAEARVIGMALLIAAAKVAGMALIILIAAAACAAPFVSCAVALWGFGDIQ